MPNIKQKKREEAKMSLKNQNALLTKYLYISSKMII